MEVEDENMEYSGRSEGKAGIFRVKIEPDSHAYRYGVDINTAERNLVAQKDRTTQSAEKAFCFQIMKSACDETEGFGVGAKTYAYDGRTILYTHKKIERLKASLFIEIQAENVGGDVRTYVKGHAINVHITPHGDGDPIELAAALPVLNGENVPPDRSIGTFIDVLITHCFLESNEYYSAAAGVLYAKQPCQTTPGMQTLVGLQKSVKFVDSQAFLMLDLHLSPFFGSCDADGQPASLLSVAQKLDHAQLEKEFQGVRMQLVNDEEKTFLFGSITHQPVRFYEAADGRALPDHYLTLGRHIDPEYYGVHPQGDNNVVHPLELVRVFAGQQWPPHKAPAELENSVTPAQRLAFIEDHARKLTVGSNGDLFAQFGLCIDLESNHVPILHRKPPNIAIADAFGRLVSVTPQANGNFFEALLRSRLLATKHPPQKWVCAHDPEVPREVAWLIVDGLAASCQRAGLNLQATPWFNTITSPDQLESLFLPTHAAYPHERFGFVLFVDAGRIPRLHDKLKLYELAYGIPTQKILKHGLSNVKSDRNLVLKLNGMFGGLNYYPIFDSAIEVLDLGKHPDLLVIGYSAVHLERASPFEIQRMQAGVGQNSIDPMAVGLAANNDVVPYVFNSSLFYQNSSEDGIDREKLTAASKEIVRKKTAVLGRLPTRLFVIRNAASDDQHTRIAAEIDAILEGWKQAAEECGAVFNELPSVTMVVANKRHRQRFFRSSGTQCANTQCGDLMLEKFVRTDTTHFFLQTHHSPRGQPKPTEYIVLRDEQQLPRGVFEKFLFALAAFHQSLASPSSLPLPAHLAEQTAAQALQILKELRRLQSEGIRPVFAQHLQQVAGVYNVDGLNRLLAHPFDRPLGAPPAQ